MINDEAKLVLKKMARADVVVFATPLYFYGPSAQIKPIMDRMFSLYKWDNTTDTLLVPNARESGEIVKLKGIREKAAAFGKKAASLAESTK